MNAAETPLRKHLEELRRRLLISVAAVVVAMGVAFVFHERIIRLLLRPSELEAAADGGAGLVFVEVTEMLAVTMKVSLLSGLVLAFPVVLFQVIMFVAPGLTSREKRYVFAFMPAVVLAFAAGVAFGYFVMIPPAISFLVGWGSDIATPMIRIGNYVNVMVTLLFWLGVVFETPVVMFLLAKLRIVSWRGFARWRRYWVVVSFILGALITPTFDPLNQALVAVPLILLYELGIWLARLAARPGPSTYPEATAEGS